VSSPSDPSASRTAGADTPGRDPDAFIAYWAEAGGAEQANAQSFVIDLCHLLTVAPPRPQQEDLRDPKMRERLRTIWTDPQSLDPTRRAAEVTRDVADRLATIAKRLERGHDPRQVATFLMRCLFTMFAEDVGLLPKHCFAELLKQRTQTPETFLLRRHDCARAEASGRLRARAGRPGTGLRLPRVGRAGRAGETRATRWAIMALGGARATGGAPPRRAARSRRSWRRAAGRAAGPVRPGGERDRSGDRLRAVDRDREPDPQRLRRQGAGAPARQKFSE
jgi:hypothetical protein